MHTTWISAIVIILAQVLPFLGVEVRSEELTTTIQTLVTLGFAVWAIIGGVRTGTFTLGGKSL